ncbi:MAG: hypothetical protein Q8891_16200 [Bacteroidota bacterium]|jgi:hypothetical protein|nr:hypothetical protein [Bacteroidota bacterium]
MKKTLSFTKGFKKLSDPDIEPIEIEEIETLWGDLSSEYEKQKKLTESLIIHLTQELYQYKLSKMMIPEIICTLVCFTGGSIIIFNLQNLNTWYLLGSGIISAMILFLLPIISIKAIRKMRLNIIINNDYEQSLTDYSKSKIQFIFAQKLNLYLSLFLLVVIIPVIGKLIGGKDILTETYLWIWGTLLGISFLYFSAKILYTYHRMTTVKSENPMREEKTEYIFHKSVLCS